MKPIWAMVEQANFFHIYLKKFSELSNNKPPIIKRMIKVFEANKQLRIRPIKSQNKPACINAEAGVGHSESNQRWKG
jgi:hypothetical protein